MPVLDVDTKAGAVSVEWIVGIVRYHGEGAGFGSPFRFALTMTVHGPEATFSAGQGTYTPPTRRALRDAMFAIGVKRVRYERVDPDGVVRHKVLVR